MLRLWVPAPAGWEAAGSPFVLSPSSISSYHGACKRRAVGCLGLERRVTVPALFPSARVPRTVLLNAVSPLPFNLN